MNDIINRLTLNHENELRRSHLSILYFLIKQTIFEIYRSYLLNLNQNPNYGIILY